jgi:phosphate transport system ATP-binding protein
MAPQEKEMVTMAAHLEFQNVSVAYGSKKALDGISLSVPRNTVLGIVGPSNSGKTTLLKTINRTIEFVPGARVSGSTRIHGTDVREMKDVYDLRRRIGMVFPLPVGLPMSIYDNVAYAPRRAGIAKKAELEGIVERCLKLAVLWDEVKDRLDLLGTRLSGGQQQRLTLARALSLDPEILCLDEFSIAIDPVTTMKIEEVLAKLKQRMTIILVTNLTQQARRMADHTAFFNASELVEWGSTEQLFTAPKKEITGRYLNGEFG